MTEFAEQLIQETLVTDKNFRRLYEKHRLLDEQVDAAHAGDRSMTDEQLEIMKKKRLLLKDQMVGIIERGTFM